MFLSKTWITFLRRKGKCHRVFQEVYLIFMGHNHPLFKIIYITWFYGVAWLLVHAEAQTQLFSNTLGHFIVIVVCYFYEIQEKESLSVVLALGGGAQGRQINQSVMWKETWLDTLNRVQTNGKRRKQKQTETNIRKWGASDCSPYVTQTFRNSRPRRRNKGPAQEA